MLVACSRARTLKPKHLRPRMFVLYCCGEGRIIGATEDRGVGTAHASAKTCCNVLGEILGAPAIHVDLPFWQPLNHYMTG